LLKGKWNSAGNVNSGEEDDSFEGGTFNNELFEADELPGDEDIQEQDLVVIEDPSSPSSQPSQTKNVSEKDHKAEKGTDKVTLPSSCFPFPSFRSLTLPSIFLFPRKRKRP